MKSMGKRCCAPVPEVHKAVPSWARTCVLDAGHDNMHKSIWPTPGHRDSYDSFSWSEKYARELVLEDNER